MSATHMVETRIGGRYSLKSMSLSLLLLDEVHCLLVASGIDVHADDGAAELAEPERRLPTHAVTCTCYLEGEQKMS